MSGLQVHLANGGKPSSRGGIRASLGAVLGNGPGPSTRDQYQQLATDDDVELEDAAGAKYEGLEVEESSAGLRRVADSLPMSAYTIALIEAAERFSVSSFGASCTHTHSRSVLRIDCGVSRSDYSVIFRLASRSQSDLGSSTSFNNLCHLARSMVHRSTRAGSQVP